MRQLFIDSGLTVQGCRGSRRKWTMVYRMAQAGLGSEGAGRGLEQSWSCRKTRRYGRLGYTRVTDDFICRRTLYTFAYSTFTCPSLTKPIGYIDDGTTLSLRDLLGIGKFFRSRTSDWYKWIQLLLSQNIPNLAQFTPAGLWRTGPLSISNILHGAFKSGLHQIRYS